MTTTIKPTKKTHPASEGWIRGKYELVHANPLSEDQIKRIVSFGKPEDYEFAHIEQNGKWLKVTYREHNWQVRCQKAA